MQMKKKESVMIFWMLIFMTPILFVLSASSWCFLIWSISIITMWNFPQESSDLFLSVNSMSSDFLSWSLIFLTLIIWNFTLTTFSSSFLSANKMFMFTMFSLFSVLILIFFSGSLLFFYFVFEASLIPIAMLILGWGYQPERIQAMVALMLYTIIASFPLLVMILNWSSISTCFFILMSSKFENFSSSTQFLMMCSITGFLVKFPMFFVHLWLPKAHVEAPVIGSMVLAALLLKLAGFGIWRLLTIFSMSSFMIVIQAISLMGGSMVGVLCMRQMDMKVMIAYSSVSHMSFAIALLASGYWFAMLSSLFLMVAHGMSSSAMFAGANLIYEKVHSRNLVLSNGMLSHFPKFTIFWFLACMGNMGTPPTINFLAETWSIVALMNLEAILWIPISLTIFFAVAFTLMIYSSSAHGQPSNFTKITTLMNHQSWSLMLVHVIYLFGMTSVFI